MPEVAQVSVLQTEAAVEVGVARLHRRVTLVRLQHVDDAQLAVLTDRLAHLSEALGVLVTQQATRIYQRYSDVTEYNPNGRRHRLQV